MDNIIVDKISIIFMKNQMIKKLTMASDVSEHSIYSAFERSNEELHEANGIFLAMKNFGMLTEQEINNTENDIERIGTKIKSIWQYNANKSSDIFLQELKTSRPSANR